MEVKKILVIDFAACEGGALSVLNDYYNEIKNTDNKYFFVLSDNYLEETNNIKILVLKKYKNRLMRLFFDFIYGNKIVKKINPDEIISLQNTIIRGTNIKQTVFIHQSIPFQKVKNFSFFKKQEFKYAIIQKLIGFIIISSARHAERVIVQTKWMKYAVAEKCNISLSRIDIKNPSLFIDNIIINDNNNSKITHFFYPTSDYLYKNNDLIYSCVNLLIKEGITNFDIEMTISGESSSHIKKIGKITREEVFSKYSNSVLVFPSYIETIGLPLLEAKKCNSIILASNTPFSHEILDDYSKVYFFDPFNVNELKRLMIKCISKEGGN